MRFRNKMLFIAAGFLVGYFIFLFVTKTFAHNYHHPIEIISPTIEASPSAKPTQEIIIEPTITDTPQSSHGDGLSDNLHTAGDGLHSAPDELGCSVHECKAEPTIIPCGENNCSWK